MQKTFDFKEIEKKWVEKWHQDGIYNADDNSSKPKKYVLVEFPYPSGSGLHIGHAFSFVGGDVYARFFRQMGYNVLFPMGWDAFGLPTENYAIKMKRKPQDVTKENTDNFKKEMNSLGLSFDWTREVFTTDPAYYKWTQWIFVKLFEKGLAYKEERPINWCPSCKIGLADEEVIDGKCERCGTETSRRNISQWIVKITDYADRLVEGLKDTAFIEKVKAAQINWIGKKEGINIDFEIKGTNEKLTVFTTTPVNFGATFLVVSPEHKFVEGIVEGKFGVDSERILEINDYISSARKKSDMERTELNRDKTGVFTGLYAMNHLTGKEIPIWISDFVLATFGTGAVQGCPGHDQRDWDFAKKFGIPIVRVVSDYEGDQNDVNDEVSVVHAGSKGFMVNSEFLNGLDFTKAMEKTMDLFEDKGWGKRVVAYHLRDWIFSRQHYWGEPIPMIHCQDCGVVAVNEADLPVVLPDVEAYEPTETGESPLANIDEWVNTICPKCGKPAKRETDTMPNWAGSDWYFLRYLDPLNTREIAGISKQEKWMPVDTYIGGDEHNTLHLLYSRFIYQFLDDLGVVATPEPYHQRVSHGVILGPDNRRMSKTRGNVIIPSDIRDRVGADATRTYLMFIGAFDATMPWNDNALNGVKRFISRVYSFVLNNKDNFAPKSSNEVSMMVNDVIEYSKKAMVNFQFNTTVAKYMELINLFEKVGPTNVSLEDAKALVVMLAPFAPFVTEDIWMELGEKYSVHTQSWPEIREGIEASNEVEIAIQVNGKVRGRVTVNKEISEEALRKIIEENASISKYFDGKTISKFVYIPGKIVNIVV